jgi:hypothetical protein
MKRQILWTSSSCMLLDDETKISRKTNGYINTEG